MDKNQIIKPNELQYIQIENTVLGRHQISLGLDENN